jgi:hypothetical protein
MRFVNQLFIVTKRKESDGRMFSHGLIATENYKSTIPIVVNYVFSSLSI